MVDPLLWSQFTTLVDEPTGENYLAARKTLSETAAYRPYCMDLQKAVDLLRADRMAEAHDLLFGALPNLLLSPRAHLFLADIAERFKDDERAALEAGIAFSCCLGIIGSGDGTQARPYFVLRVEDEYDVLHYLEKSMVQQRLVAHGERHFDIITCEDNSEIWFDVTDLRKIGESQVEPDDFEQDFLN